MTKSKIVSASGSASGGNDGAFDAYGRSYSQALEQEMNKAANEVRRAGGDGPAQKAAKMRRRAELQANWPNI